MVTAGELGWIDKANSHRLERAFQPWTIDSGAEAAPSHTFQVNLIDSLGHSWPATNSLTAGRSYASTLERTRAARSADDEYRKPTALVKRLPPSSPCGWLLANEYEFDIFTR